LIVRIVIASLQIDFSVHWTFVNNTLVFNGKICLPAIIGYLASQERFMDSSQLMYTIKVKMNMKESYIYLTFEPMCAFNFSYRIMSVI
jgi:hypothetical protein